MLRLSPIFVVIIAIALTMPAVVNAQELPPVQFAGGYTYVTNPSAVMTNTSDETGDAPRSGWFADVIGNITPRIGIVGEVAATYTTGTLRSRNWRGTHHAYSFLGGARVTSRCCRAVAPFAHVLAGAVRISHKIEEGGGRIGSFTDKYFGLVFGGGADIRMGSGPVALQLAADGFLIAQGRAFGVDDNTLRIRVGVVVPMR